MGDKVTCRRCRWGVDISPQVRLGLRQGNKEILNLLLRSRYRIQDFRYCEKQGFLESAIARKECDDWESRS